MKLEIPTRRAADNHSVIDVVEKKKMMEEPTISIEVKKLQEIRDILQSALEPMTPYKRDPLEFSEAAHEEKDKLIKEALLKLPLALYSSK